MLFALIGFFHTPVGAESADFEQELTDHLSQQVLHICLAGTLRDGEGRHTGYMAVIKAPDFAAAQAYVGQSPYFKADRYARIDIVEYALLVGAGQLK